MTDSPRISVVMPFFNPGRFFSDAVESVLAQDFASWELLLVDDGSTDGSSDAARSYARREPGRVRYIAHEGHANLGLSASRNAGVRNAGAELIAFVDADDVLLPHALRERCAAIDRHPEVAMAYGPLIHWYGWTGDPRDAARDFVQDLGVEPNSVVRPPDLPRLFVSDSSHTPQSVLIRRDALLRVGGYEESFRGLYEDQVLYAKVCLREAAFASGTPVYRYRRHPASLCARVEATGRRDPTRRLFLEWLARHIDASGIEDAELRALVRRQLWRETWPDRHPRLYALLRPVVRRARSLKGRAMPLAPSASAVAGARAGGAREPLSTPVAGRRPRRR